MMQNVSSQEITNSLEHGPFPYKDGWGWFYKTLERIAPQDNSLRKIICAYFYPAKVEMKNDRQLYRLLGVYQFGRIIPTGGIAIRRLTNSRMTPYVLRASSVAAAREFYYRTCCFEAAHFPFMIAMFILAVNQLLAGRADLAIEDLTINMVLNVYPIMHHRNTRARIVALLLKRRNRS